MTRSSSATLSRSSTAAASTNSRVPLTEQAALLRDELRAQMVLVDELTVGQWTMRIHQGRDSLWGFVRRRGSSATVVLRLAYCPGGIQALHPTCLDGAREWEMQGALGAYHLRVSGNGTDPSFFRWSVDLIPVVDTFVDHVPRDIYLVGSDHDPRSAVGEIRAAQRGLNTALCYFQLQEPALGTCLYLANLTSLNDYFRATKTKPDGAVGGRWPELGYLPPTAPANPTEPTAPLAAGVRVRVTDSLLALEPELPSDADDVARTFLTMLGSLYSEIDHPATEYRDWVTRAEWTLRDLQSEPDATVSEYGHTYIRPYLAAEYPDVMAQSSIVASMRDFTAWSGQEVPFVEELASAITRFQDKRLGTMRRYLPNVGSDKNPNAVDSWYLYHPLLSLGRMASAGDQRAARLVDQSIDFAIDAARHFKYAWPVQFDVRDFSVLQGPRNEGGLGQTDVGGIYAAVMLLAFDRCGDERFLDEARAAVDAAADMRFELEYQANLTAWGAAACAGLWRRTGEDTYLRRSHSYLASFFHNTQMWESEIEHAAHFRNFLGATCLHDAPYMAMLECFDSFAALHEYLRDAADVIDPRVRLLVTQYCKYALDRAWFYYPDALPAQAIASNSRNGRIDRSLSIPLEDLYADGQPAGQVGQEIYGAGAAFVFASQAFHRIEGAPFQLFCDHFLVERPVVPRDGEVTFTACGVDGYPVSLNVVRLKRRKLPRVVVRAGDEAIPPEMTSPDRVEFRVPAERLITVDWQA